MRRYAIRLGIPIIGLLIALQFLLPVYLEHRVANRLTDHGGSADVTLRAFPVFKLLFGSGDKLDIHARALSVDLEQNQEDVFKRLDEFDNVSVAIDASRAGPFSIGAFRLKRIAPHVYELVVRGNATAADVARYAGARLAGDFGQALAGLAASALGAFGPVPFNARMQIVTGAGTPRAQNVVGDVAGLPAGPLAQVVANALLSGL